MGVENFRKSNFSRVGNAKPSNMLEFKVLDTSNSPIIDISVALGQVAISAKMKFGSWLVSLGIKFLS
jgi:hypothetical protein